MDRCFNGESLYGEDFTDDQINKWFLEESMGYANLGAKDRANYHYKSHALNKFQAYKHLDSKLKDLKVLSVGGAYGDELLPIVNKINEIYILEPSNCFINSNINGVKTTYLEAKPSGIIPLDDNSIDLVTCFGALHHLPRIKPTIREIYRVLKPNGIALIREPCESMGDWTKPRKGLTKNERGIPPTIMNQILLENGFTIEKSRKWQFTLTMLLTMHGVAAYNSMILTMLDDFISNSFPWKYKYNPISLFEKIRPSCIFYKLRK
jgi:ubiquinone/menaquinone biosynthesis C-methylase UbiE